MRARWLVLAVTAGACVAIPPPPAGRRLLDVDAVTGRVATRSDAPFQYTVEFSDRNPRMPQAIVIDGVNRLAGDACPLEAGVGIGVYPAFAAGAPGLSGTETQGGTFDVQWAGPVIARIAVGWNFHYDCSGAQIAQGTSTFTLFPNGRIVRHDVATPSTTTLTPDATSCGSCTNDTSFYFTSFWTFAAGSQNVAPDGTPFVDGMSQQACAVYPNHTIGVSWPEALPTRVITGRAVTPFVFDWANNVAMLAPTEREATTAIVLSEEHAPAKCADVVADLARFQITSGSRQVDPDDNGIYQDPDRHTSPFAISTPRQLPRGFAISLDIGDHATVTRQPAREGAWYGAQPDGARTVLWFRDGLAVNETISIEP